MLLARGMLQERPWGRTLGMLARRSLTGQLTIECAGLVYAIAFREGHVIAALSPDPADTAIAVALQRDMITPGQAAAAGRLLAAKPGADELDVLGAVAELSPEQLHLLSRRTLVQRAARTFALPRGEFVVTREISIPVPADGATHVGGIIFQGALANLDETRLREDLRQLGSRFELRRDAVDELPYFGFGEASRQALRALAGGLHLGTVAAIADGAERHAALTTLYALAACGAVYCESPEATQRLARGTQDPIAHRARSGSVPPAVARTRTAAPAAVPMLSTEPVAKASAVAAYRDGKLALRHERVADAVVDLARAVELDPQNLEYQSALAWARFCATSDKSQIAADTRRALERAIHHVDDPAEPRYYLGLVERMLGREADALRHFRAVLEAQPDHREAQAELRVLAARQARKR